MLVHVIARPQSGSRHLPRRAVTDIAAAIRTAGGGAVLDVALGDVGGPSLPTPVSQPGPGEPGQALVIHAFGSVAVELALRERTGHVPIVATFDEFPADDEAEQALAHQVDAVLPLSSREAEDWARRGVRTLSSGAISLPIDVRGELPTLRLSDRVVTLSTGSVLRWIVSSMPAWDPGRLVIMSRLSAAELAQVQRMAVQLGVRDRIDYRPALSGAARRSLWRDAALLVAGSDGARHGGHVLEAAAHGIPSIAVASLAHLDQIVPGATGMLLDPDARPHDLGLAVCTMLNDPIQLRGMGTSALVRVRALHNTRIAGERLLALFGQVCQEGDPLESLPSALTPRQSQLALEHLALAKQLAHWYAGRGQPMDDLVQVASLGLVRAAERFDPTHGKEFHSFAIPTILGELRRHFRDHAWAVRLPRGLQEATLHVHRASDELRQSLGHDPSAADVAGHLGLIEEDVVAAQQAEDEARTPRSLDHPIGPGGSGALADVVGSPDPSLELIEEVLDVRAAIRKLPRREQEILLMRFYGERTQSEIAAHLGISQVHVSRVLSRTLAAIRDHVLYDIPLPNAHEPLSPIVGTRSGRRAAS